MNFNIQPLSTLVFSVFHKNGSIESCSSGEDLSAYGISWPRVDWFNFFIHFRSSNVRSFGLVETAVLKSMASTSPSWHDLCAEFHENLITRSEIISGGHTDTMVNSKSSLFFFRESRLM
jgi:hypothetical protein